MKSSHDFFNPVTAILLFSAIVSNGFVSASNHDLSLRVMTYNIRYAGKADTGAISWNHRKDFVRSIILFHKADIIGLQEVLHSQLTYLDSALSGFAHVGCGRDDGKTAGEYSPIFFRKERFEVQSSGTFWLSPEADVPGKGWDAALPRICTWVELKDRRNNKNFFVFNTHFDHQGKQARVESAKLVLDKIRVIAGGAPVILTGDFNDEKQSESIKIIARSPESSTLGFRDAMYISVQPHHGPDQTFCGFNVRDGIAGGRIDYVFVNSPWSVHSHATLTDFRGNYFPSDHFPVLSEIELSP